MHLCTAPFYQQADLKLADRRAAAAEDFGTAGQAQAKDAEYQVGAEGARSVGTCVGKCGVEDRDLSSHALPCC